MKQKLTLILFLITFLLNPCYGKKSQSSMESIAKFEVSIKDSNSKESKIKTNLKRLSNWNYFEDQEFNIDSFNLTIANELIEYLSEKLFPVDSNTINLTRITSPDKHVNIYNYSYVSGGTAGDIPTAIIQWKKSNGKFGAKILNLSSFFYQSFKVSEIKDHTLYLFIGGWKGSSRLECACAQVIELIGDSLNLEYPAFYNQYSTLLYFDDLYSPDNSDNYCMACIDYSTKTKEISITDLGSDDQVGPKAGNSLSVQDFLKGRTEIYYVFDGERYKEK